MENTRSKEDFIKKTQFMIESDISITEIKNSLISQGLSEAEASQIYEAADEALDKARRSGGIKKLVLGLVVLVIGLAVTFGTGNVIAYGAIIYGIINVVIGAAALANA